MQINKVEICGVNTSELPVLKNNQMTELLIKIKDGEIAHIRPKAKDSSDLMITPQGTYEKRKCFWLNAKYIKEQIEKED